MKFLILSAHDEGAPGPGARFPDAENAMEEIYFEKLKKFNIEKKPSKRYFAETDYFVEINTLEDLLKLIEEVDNPIIVTPEGEIWIYDGWIE